MAISRMQNPQQLQGIGSLRQPYGLGKLVKKAFKGVKKIAKSPLGKAAILGGLGMYGMGAGPWASGGMWGKAKGAGFLKNIMASRALPFDWKNKAATTKGGGFFKTGLGRFLNPWSGAFGDKGAGVFNPKHAFGLLGAGAVSVPFIQSA